MRIPPRILVANDHPMVLRGIRDSLQVLPAEVKVSFTPAAVIALLSRETFDLLVLGISFPDSELTGYDVLRAARHRYPNLLVIMVSAFDDWVLQEATRRDGARAFLSKREPRNVWLTATKEVLAGRLYFRKPMKQEQEHHMLTVRQLELAHLLSAGLTENECAVALGITLSMVEKHAHDAKRRLGARTMVQLISEFALRGFHLLPAGRTDLVLRHTKDPGEMLAIELGGGCKQSWLQPLSSQVESPIPAVRRVIWGRNRRNKDVDASSEDHSGYGAR